MAWAFVDAAANGAGSQNTLAKAVTAGNMLVFVRIMQTGTDTPTISDGVNSWTQVTASPLQDTTHAAGIAMWAAVAATTATITVTVSGSTNTGFAGNALLEYSGGPAAVQLDGSAGTPNITGSTAPNGMSSGSFTTGTNGDLIVSVINDDGSTDTATQYTAGSSPVAFTKRATASQDPGGSSATTFAVQDCVQSAAGSINPTWTENLGHVAVCLAAAFKIVGGNLSTLIGEPPVGASPLR